ncbi:MAG TPA: hypothetical protein VIG04_00715 [Gemmatimonadales bacterium]
MVASLAAEWRSASNVVGHGGAAGQRGSKDVLPATPPGGGEIKPAA